MEYKTLITVQQLEQELDSPNLAVMDCRFDLDDPEKGHREYLEAHIPGAVYVNLDRDLSGEIIPGTTGRHPLPDSAVFADQLSEWGIDQSTQVVAYDSRGGAIAARLWWMLRWLGHDLAAVLDGGWQAWENASLPVESGEYSRKPKEFVPHEKSQYLVDKEYVDRIRLDPDYLLLDARSPERYWGIKEPLDEKTGHIPGAVTAPYTANLDSEGFFLKKEDLQDRFQELLNGLPAEQVVVYCGSGVTAIHNIIAMVEAGFDLPRLYSGSWSEWITDPDLPVAPQPADGKES